MRSSVKKIIKKIDNAVDKNKSIDYEIEDVDDLLDVLDYYANNIHIHWPSHIIQLDSVNASVLVNEIKTVLSQTYDTDELIEFIERKIDDLNMPDEFESDAPIRDKEQLNKIVDHFELRYPISIKSNISNRPSIEELYTAIHDLREYYVDYEYLIIYAKLYENKQTKEVVLEGPFFGEQANSKEEIDEKAKDLVEKQQSNALLVKVYERDGRTDKEVMDIAKKHYNKLREELEETNDV